MSHTRWSICAALLLIACGGSSPTPANSGQAADGKPDADEFQTKYSTTAGSAHGASESRIKATKTQAAMKFFVVDKVKNEAITGIVISLQGADGKKFYTEETDEAGYGEVLVPVGQAYDLAYLSLGRKDITAKVKVEDEPFQNIKLTLRYKPREVEPATVVSDVDEDQDPGTESEPVEEQQPAFRLDGVVFDSGSSVILPESFLRLDSVVEYMTYKKSARIEISGHTDNVGAAKTNKTLSQTRAQACRDYLIKNGIDGSRIEAVGHGDEKPIARNNSDKGRQENRRIEVREL